MGHRSPPLDGRRHAWTSRWFHIVFVMMTALSTATTADAAPPLPGAPPAADAAPEEEKPAVDPASPRAAFEAYLQHARDGEFDAAAAYLQLRKIDVARAPTLAERLWFVLERHDGVDVDVLSAEAKGEENDGLPKGVERVAAIRSATGQYEDVLLKRVATTEGERWLFSRETVARVDGWYEDLDEPRLLHMLPEPLRRGGPLGLLWWQWGAFVVVILSAWLLGGILRRITTRTFKALFGRVRSTRTGKVVARNKGPITLLWATVLCWVSVPLLDLFPAAEATVRAILRLAGLVALFWAFSSAADVYAAHAATSTWALRNPASKNLIPLASRLLKVIVLGGAAVGLAAHLGFPVGSLVAGVGIGGLALALAGQKTIENLFGAVSLAIDQPLREGDLVKIGEEIGTVEAIGLRSTRIRSLHRTVIAIPNGKLAEMTIESLAARDRMRFECNIALAYETRSEQIRRVLDDVRGVLDAHPSVLSDSVDVHLVGYGPSSLDIEITACVTTTVLSDFLDVRQDLLLAFMRVVEDAGTRFALPAQSLHLSAGGGAEGVLVPAAAPASRAATDEH